MCRGTLLLQAQGKGRREAQVGAFQAGEEARNPGTRRSDFSLRDRDPGERYGVLYRSRRQQQIIALGLAIPPRTSHGAPLPLVALWLIIRLRSGAQRCLRVLRSQYCSQGQLRRVTGARTAA